ncbi:AMP-binding protein [Chloroflexota bacterium]
MKPTRWTAELIEYYTQKGALTSETWSDIYDRNARLLPDKEAFVVYAGGKRKSVTWSQMKQWTDRLALGFIELGINRDDRVLCQTPPCIENVALRIAMEKAGFIFCYSPINTWEAENDHFLKGLEAVAVVTKPEYHKRNHFEMFRRLRYSGRHPYLNYIFAVGEEVPEGAISIENIIQTPLEERYPSDFLKDKKVDPHEVAFIMTTTGSTGMPKMVEMPPSSSIAHGHVHLERWNLSQDDICFTPSFMWTGPTSSSLLTLPQVGGRVIMMEVFEAEEALQIIEREKPTYIGSFPAQIIDIVNHPNFDRYDKSSLRFFQTAGAPFASALAEECEGKLQCPYMNGFGAVDSSMLFLNSLNTPKHIRFQSIGKPSKWDDYKVVNADGSLARQGEIGTLYWRGPGGSSGYYRDIELTKKAWGKLGLEGWCNTEDAAWLDEEGNVYLVGRVGDMIIRGGQNIFPAEIENILGSHPETESIQIVAMPDTRLGEKACAYVIPKNKVELTLEKLTVYMAEKGVAKYKYPERLEIVEHFPTVGQKINRRALGLDICRKLVAEGQVSEKLAEDFEKKRKLT